MVNPNDSGLKVRADSRLADTYEIVNDPSTDSIISWSESGKSFIVWKPEEFARVFLPKLLLSHEFSVFTMLYRFGFRKIGSGRREFAHDDFVKGKPELLKKIRYREEAEDRLATKKLNMKRKSHQKDKKAAMEVVYELRRERFRIRIAAKAVAMAVAANESRSQRVKNEKAAMAVADEFRSLKLKNEESAMAE